MKIGELAARTDVSVRSLRYYEQQGLLASTRTSGGQRRYDEHAVTRVTFIQRLFAAGLSTRTILELLPCVVSPSAHNSDAALTAMIRERDRMSRTIEELVTARDGLDTLIDANLAHRASPTT